MNFDKDVATTDRCQQNDIAMTIALENHGTVTVLRPRGDIDKTQAAELVELMESAMDDGARHLVLDLSEVTHVGSDGLKAIVGVVRQLQPRSGTVMLAAVRDGVRSLLSAGGFLLLLREFDDSDTAIQAAAALTRAGQGD